MQHIIHINSLSQANKMFGVPPPKHPLVAVIWAKDFPHIDEIKDLKFTTDLYLISFKDGITGSIAYGRNTYDFNEGTMVFTKPKQAMSFENKNIEDDTNGWVLAFHPDLLRKAPLGTAIHNYNFFDYEVHEALHLSDEEKRTLIDLAKKIEAEINQNIDKHSQKLIIATIELMLDYCHRYYDRQFYVRANLHLDHVSDFENLLKNYFQSEAPSTNGLPSVKYCGEQLSMSPNYLSDVLKKETGMSAKDHIYNFVVDLAKNKLLGSRLSVSEIAYDLGFEYPQHFSKLFKKQTGHSPLKYRQLN